MSLTINGVRGSSAATSSPYVGLTHFTEGEADLFFGREAERKRIIGNLRASRLTLLYAESGVGKSSLLRAGVAARLRELAARGSGDRGPLRYVPVVFSSWRDDPVEALIGEIESAVRPAVPDPSTLQLPRDGLEAAIEHAAGALGAAVLVILDQFEDYFLYHGDGGAGSRFADDLARCVNRPDLRANFLISIREDSYSRLGDRFKARIPNVYGNYLHLDYLDERAARDAIEKPIEKVNRHRGEEDAFSIEPALVETVLEEVRRGQVAIAGGEAAAEGSRDGAGGRIETAYLQLVMKRLWDEETAAGSRVLRLETLRRLGNAETIIRTHLDDAMAALSAGQQDAAESVFRFLVTSTGRKIALTAAELSEFSDLPEPAVQPALDHLRDARILRPVAPPEPSIPGSDGARLGSATRYEIFHDVLAPAILDWRRRHADDRQREETERRLDEQRIEARRERRRARRFRTIALAAIALAVASTVLGVVFWRQRQLSNSRALAARSAAVLGLDPARSVQLALDAIDAKRTNQAEEALRTAYPDFLELRILRGHSDIVHSATFSPDGRYVATGAEDKTILIRDARTGKLFRPPLRGHARTIWRVAFSPNGRYLASASSDGTARVWDWRNLRTTRAVATLRHPGEVYSARFSPNGRYVVTADRDPVVRVWDWRSDRRNPRDRLAAPNASFMDDAAFSPDGRSVIAGGYASVGGYVVGLIWPLGHPGLRMLSFHTGPIRSVGFSPNGQWALTGSDDKKTCIWNLREHAAPGTCRYVLAGATAGVSAASFSNDGDRVVTASEDGTAVLWDWRAQRPLTELRGHTDAVFDAEFDRRATRVVTASADHTARVWDATTSAAREFRQGSAPVSSVAFSRHGRFLLTAGAYGDWRVWDDDSGWPVKTGKDHGGTILDASFSPDGSRIVTAGDDGVARIWRWRGTASPILLRGHTGLVSSAAFSPDGRRVVTSSYDRTAKIWAARTGRLVRTLSGHRDSVYAARFSPDGGEVVTASDDGTATIWDAERGAALHTLRGHLGIVKDAAFSPDGKLVVTASSDRTARVWDAETGKPLRTLVGYTGPVRSARFSPSGTWILTGGDDGTTRIWDARSGKIVTILRMHAYRVNDAEFSADGKLIASASDDFTAKIYRCRTCLSLDRLVGLAETREKALRQR